MLCHRECAHGGHGVAQQITDGHSVHGTRLGRDHDIQGNLLEPRPVHAGIDDASQSAGNSVLGAMGPRPAHVEHEAVVEIRNLQGVLESILQGLRGIYRRCGRDEIQVLRGSGAQSESQLQGEAALERPRGILREWGEQTREGMLLTCSEHRDTERRGLIAQSLRETLHARITHVRPPPTVHVRGAARRRQAGPRSGAAAAVVSRRPSRAHPRRRHRRAPGSRGHPPRQQGCAARS